MIKQEMNEVHELCRSIMGSRYKDSYIEDLLDFNETLNPPAHKSINLGFSSWT
jgi:hypothetical protein